MLENNDDQRLQLLLHTQGRSHKMYDVEIVVKYKLLSWRTHKKNSDFVLGLHSQFIC